MQIVVSGARIHATRWGEGRIRWVLVHGGGAHEAWWHRTVHTLAPDGVITLDLSGHGRSAHRAEYSFSTWADEIRAVVAAYDAVDAVLVAHSMGGAPAVIAAAQPHARFRALVLVDSIVPVRSATYFPPAIPRRVYAKLESAVERFRFRPEDPWVDDAARRQLARESVVEVDGGWSWRFDPRIFTAAQRNLANAYLGELRIPVVYVRAAGGGVVDEGMVREMIDRVPTPVRVETVPNAGHHFIVDRPEPLIEALRSLAAQIAQTEIDSRHARSQYPRKAGKSMTTLVSETKVPGGPRR